MPYSDELFQIIEENSYSIDNECYSVVIEKIIKKFDCKLNYVFQFLHLLNEADVTRNIELFGDLKAVLEDSLNVQNIGTVKNQIYYPKQFWNGLLQSEISKIMSCLEMLFGINYDINTLVKLQNIKINFSDKQPTEQFGQYSKSNIMETIRSYLQKYPNTSDNIKDVLNRILIYIEESEDDKNLIIQKLTMLINEYKNNLPKNEIKDLQKILDKFKKMKFSSELLGCFNLNFSITLYVESIFNYALKHKVSFHNALREVFAHEMFHAYHYLIINDKATWQNCSKIIKESFASYFEYLYCNNEGIYVFDLENEWHKNDMNIYPYSGAQYIKDNVFKTRKFSHSSSKKFNKISFENCISFDFEHLFNLALLDESSALRVFDLFYNYDNI